MISLEPALSKMNRILVHCLPRPRCIIQSLYYINPAILIPPSACICFTTSCPTTLNAFKYFSAQALTQEFSLLESEDPGFGRQRSKQVLLTFCSRQHPLAQFRKDRWRI